MTAAADAAHMRRALALARRGAGRTSPNPMVGAVVARGGTVLGEGWYKGPPGPHAETAALAAAGRRAAGATLYVTLEPCAHHGSTPPCAKTVVEAGIKRVVSAMGDPDPRVAGRGHAMLRRARVEVEVGLGEAAATHLNQAYLLHRSAGRPFVTYKAALTLDGRTAAADGTSRWITGEASRRDAHRLRAESDAVCVGAGTILADDPLLTVRGRRAPRPPLRVVVDTMARTPPSAALFDGEGPVVVAVGERAPASRVRALSAAGAEVVRPGGGPRGVSPPALLKLLGDRPVLSLLLEGGPRLAGSFAAAGLIDRYVFYLAAAVMGGEGTRSVLEGWGAASIADKRGLVFESVRRIGADIRIVARPAAP